MWKLRYDVAAYLLPGDCTLAVPASILIMGDVFPTTYFVIKLFLRRRWDNSTR